MSRAVMRQALEALENISNWLPTIGQKGLRDYEADAITALRDALEKNQFHPDWDEKAVLVEEMQRMAKQIADMKSEQEPWLLESTQTLAKTLAREFYPEVTQWECLDTLSGVISQIDNMTTGLMRKPEQEPVGRFAKFSDGLWREVTEYSDGVMLYTSPPQRQPLTYEQIDSMWQNTDTGDSELDAREFARTIEAKLKEKNKCL
jgi:hypothetical protein